VSQSIRAKQDGKPQKPYPAFPLFAHASGRWGKKVRRKIRFYGRWGHKSGAAIVPVDDIEASARAAKLEFDRCWPWHSQGREAPPKDAGDLATFKTLCNAFLTAKQNRVTTGELSLHSLGEYRRTCDLLIDHFGRERRLDDLRPDDFEKFRSVLGKGVNVVTLKSKINRCRVVLNYAHKNRMIDRPIEFGAAFDRPSDKILRRARHQNGQRMFEAVELRKLLDAADVTMKAMILLAANGGFGNTDLANMPLTAVDLDSGWINFPREKTAVPRRTPLWPETIAAVRKAIEARPAPKDPADAGLCFLTTRGTRFVRVQESRKSADHYNTINSLSRTFELLMERAGVEDRRGRGFYAIRHGFETIAGESNDQVATDALMGHVDSSMAGAYRERISDERLMAVVNHVRAWVFPAKRRAR
jgi:integrase